MKVWMYQEEEYENLEKLIKEELIRNQDYYLRVFVAELTE